MAATLGAPRWKDPERRQSIKYDSRVKMEWRISAPFSSMTCWIALAPARPCLTDVMDQIEALFEKRNRELWDGETTAPGCAWDRSMHGKSVDDAQPTIVFSSLSKVCRRNARNIILDENIKVDPRGIGMGYYTTGPEFFAGEVANRRRDGRTTPPQPRLKASSQSTSANRQTGALFEAFRDDSPDPEFPEVVGSSVRIGAKDCSMGGIIAIEGKLYTLTVAHVFEAQLQTMKDSLDNKSIKAIHHGDYVSVGVLHEKRQIEKEQTSRKDLDWALCVIDIHKVRISNVFHLPDGSDTVTRGIMLGSPSNAAVWVHTGSGTVKGFMMADHSLVALPGTKTFQRMWIVILDRHIRNGDCGSWVTSTDGDWIGHVVAGKPETEVAYIVLAKDIIEDICSQLGDCNITLPTEVDFVAEVVSSAKVDLSRQDRNGGQLQRSQGRSPLGSVYDLPSDFPSTSRREQLQPLRQTFATGSGLEMEETRHTSYPAAESSTENDTLLSGCASRRSIYHQRLSSSLLFILPLWSTVGSFTILLLAVEAGKPGSNDLGPRLWLFSENSYLVVFFARIVEMLSALVFASFLGQVYSRRMITKNARAAPTLAEMFQKDLMLQPLYALLSMKFVSSLLMGLVFMFVPLLSMSYTTAAVTLVAPQTPHYFRMQTQSSGYVETSYANLQFLTTQCRGMNILESGNVDCLKLDYSRRAPQDYIAFAKDWANGTRDFTGDWPLYSERPRGAVIVPNNFTAQGSWVELRDMAYESAKVGRIVDSVSLAMPHSNVIRPGLAAYYQRRDPRYDTHSKFDYHASVLSPTVNVLCVNMAPKDLSPQVYSLWPTARLVSSDPSGPEVPWDWQTELPMISDEEWLNQTTVDDVFKWGKTHNRRPPIFPMLPPDSHAIINSSVYNGDSLYILFKRPSIENYTMCSLRSYSRTDCETRYTPLEDKPGFLDTFCERESISPQNDQYSTGWREIAAVWAEALFPSIGIGNTALAKAEFLTQLIPTTPQLSTKNPSITEALAVLSACTLIDSSIGSPFSHPFNLSEPPINATTRWQTINASISVQSLSWRHESVWFWFPMLLILGCIAFMNMLGLFYFFVNREWVTDFTNRQNMFALAINSPPSEHMKGACGGGPSKEQMHVRWQVVLDEYTGHYQVEGHPPG